MRKEYLQYVCEVRESKVHLELEIWHVATYPLTYSSQDCLEHWCETAGWEFLECRDDCSTLVCKVPRGHETMSVIYRHANWQRRGLGTVI